MAEQAEKWAAEAKTETGKEGWLRVAKMWRALAGEDASNPPSLPNSH